MNVRSAGHRWCHRRVAIRNSSEGRKCWTVAVGDNDVVETCITVFGLGQSRFDHDRMIRIHNKANFSLKPIITLCTTDGPHRYGLKTFLLQVKGQSTGATAIPREDFSDEQGLFVGEDPTLFRMIRTCDRRIQHTCHLGLYRSSIVRWLERCHWCDVIDWYLCRHRDRRMCPVYDRRVDLVKETQSSNDGLWWAFVLPLRRLPADGPLVISQSNSSVFFTFSHPQKVSSSKSQLFGCVHGTDKRSMSSMEISPWRIEQFDQSEEQQQVEHSLQILCQSHLRRWRERDLRIPSARGLFARHCPHSHPVTKARFASYCSPSQYSHRHSIDRRHDHTYGTRILSNGHWPAVRWWKSNEPCRRVFVETMILKRNQALVLFISLLKKDRLTDEHEVTFRCAEGVI